LDDVGPPPAAVGGNTAEEMDAIPPPPIDATLNVRGDYRMQYNNGTVQIAASSGSITGRVGNDGVFRFTNPDGSKGEFNVHDEFLTGTEASIAHKLSTPYDLQQGGTYAGRSIWGREADLDGNNVISKAEEGIAREKEQLRRFNEDMTNGNRGDINNREARQIINQYGTKGAKTLTGEQYKAYQAAQEDAGMER
jgi:hypothetical protein